ncbi:hypothetical protein [Alicyclobacillus mengziensis]|uniref:Uncharacterized protein n=1 Tax=Alicyclobacillus mengziensis TaxID=2931921 RepID=A0A9X7W2L2_9BACL|nr:hypothetical protein [Alicyclobacillus mengziensis]QSO49357.1 hypothetical protein JZ786_10775 [Alicyclobacillus mengziensis]
MTLDIQDRLLELLVRTGAIRVRMSEDELPFWYTSCVPGPYYINVEKIIGADTSQKALADITKVLRSVESPDTRAKQIWEIITNYFHKNTQYSEVITLLVAYYNSIEHQPLPPAISGGERRDWFFSVPFAQLLSVPHLFLFKTGDLTAVDTDGQPVARWNYGQVLHVSDIVNTATSYTRHWLPILNQNDLELSETFTVAVRGTPGLHELERRGVKTLTSLELSAEVFNAAHDKGLISEFSLAEIVQYMNSPREWTRELLKQCGDQMLSSFSGLDATQQARMRSFIQNDPYQLYEEFPLFFDRVKIGI